MKLNRRGFLRALPAAPLAAKAAADAAIMESSNIGRIGMFPGDQAKNCAPVAYDKNWYDRRKSIFLSPDVGSEIRSFLFEKNRQVQYIDPDIACLRSFSLNAKIAFQRARNVERQFQAEITESVWTRMEQYVASKLRIF